jgi:uncharacterized membrane protein
MKDNESKLGGLLGVGGLIVGLSFAIKKDKSFVVSALYTLGFGAVGMILGNQITKFYQ